MEKQDKVIICAVGDVYPDREDPESTFAYSVPIIREAIAEGAEVGRKI